MTPPLDFLRDSAPSAFEHFIWPMLWQSSLLSGVLFVLDTLMRKRLRPAIRHALWLLLLVKLLLPPSLALPTGIAWWLRPFPVDAGTSKKTTIMVGYGPPKTIELALKTAAALPPRASRPLPASAWILLTSSGVSFAFLGVMLLRWRQIALMANEAIPAPHWLARLLEEISSQIGISGRIALRLTNRHLSPALCGFFHPVILLPSSLTDTLTPKQLRAVLLHELIHFRRRDVWVNALQAILQVVYWWHPLLLLANARIRRLREEAVDDAVMLALRKDADVYAPTLLEVAKLALMRPLSSLGLVGIFESRTAFRERIQRLSNFHPPRSAGLSFISGLAIFAFALGILPMGNGPALRSQSLSPSADRPWPDPRFSGYKCLSLQSRFFVADEFGLQNVAPPAGKDFYVLNSNELARVLLRIEQAHLPEIPEAGQVQFQAFSGGVFSWLIGGPTNNSVEYHTRTFGNRTMITGAEGQFSVKLPRWVPLKLQVVPWLDQDCLRCQVCLEPTEASASPRWLDVALPPSGGAFWVKRSTESSDQYQLVLLLDSGTNPGAQPKLNEPGRGLAAENDIKAHQFVAEGRLLYQSNQLDQAANKFRQALSFNRNTPWASFYLGLMEAAPKNDKAVPTLSGNTNSFPSGTATIQELKLPLAQVQLRVSFFEVPKTFDDSQLKAYLPAKDSEPRGALTGPQVSVLSKALDSNPECNLLGQASVTTQFGRRTEVEAVEPTVVVMSMVPKALIPPGVSSNDVPYVTTNMAFGYMLHITPRLSTKGSLIELTTEATHTEFLGYDKPDHKVSIYVDGKAFSAVQPRPRIRRHYIPVEKLKVENGHTVILIESVEANPGTTAAPDVASKSFLVLITPSLVDSSGTPVKE